MFPGNNKKVFYAVLLSASAFAISAGAADPLTATNPSQKKNTNQAKSPTKTSSPAKSQGPIKKVSNSQVPAVQKASPLDLPMGKPVLNSTSGTSNSNPLPAPKPIAGTPPLATKNPTAAENSKNQRTRTETKRTSSGPGFFSEFDKRASLSYGTWREPLTYAYGTTNSGGKASFAGFFARYELSKPAKPVNWGAALALFYGGADAKSNDSITYRVNKVGIQALVFSPFAYWEAMPEVRLKLALDVVYKVISWPSTAGSYDVKTKPFGYGPNIGLEYQIWKQLALEQKIGSYSTAGDVFWLIGATYKFK